MVLNYYFLIICKKLSSCLELQLSFCIMLLLKQKMFLGVSSVVRMTTECGKDNFRWYDEQKNTNIQFPKILFFVLYHLMLSGNF